MLQLPLRTTTIMISGSIYILLTIMIMSVYGTSQPPIFALDIGSISQPPMAKTRYAIIKGIAIIVRPLALNILKAKR